MTNPEHQKRPLGKAIVSFLPYSSGDGYDYGGGLVVTIDGISVAFGESAKAKIIGAEVAGRFNACAALVADNEKLRDVLSDWLAFAEEELSAFDVEGEGDPCDCESLCPECRSSGCIQDKIARTRAALASPEGRS